jgi:chromosome segregation ATPase
VQGLEQTLDATGAALEELADRTGVMDEHLRNVKTELAYTQQRVTSKAKEVQSELHLRALNQRESARMHADMKALHKERSELQERNLNLQSQIYRANERMDQFKVSVSGYIQRPCLLYW